MTVSQPSSTLVVAATPDLEVPVRAALRALRRADAAFGDAFETRFLPPGAAEESSRSFGADRRPLAPEDWNALATACRAQWPDHGLRLVFMNRAFSDHWFSHPLGEHATVLVSLSGWEELSPLPREAFIAYELLLWGGGLLAEGYDARRLLHEEPNGCIFDMCMQKRSINQKLRIADTCPRCRALLAEMEVPLERFRALLEVIRRLAMAPWPDA